jgi:O-antigen/teichoic acid export membrane protein
MMTKINFKKIYKENGNIIKNVIGSLFVRGGALVVSLLLLPAYIRFFNGKTVLGVWYTILSILNWVLMFDLGLGHGLRNKLPEAIACNDADSIKSYICSTYCSTVFITGILSIIGVAIINVLNWNSIINVDNSLVSGKTLKTTIIIVFIGIMFQFILKLVTSILYALQKAAIVNFLTMLSNVIILISLYLIPSSTTEENLINMAFINVMAVNVPLLVTSIIVFSTVLKDYFPSIHDFSKQAAFQVLNIGVTFLWLQLTFMVISSTNEFLISFLTSPDAVVEYQVYFKIYNAISGVFVLALTPIWSAVTKAQIEKKYSWITKLYRILLWGAAAIFVVELGIIPIFQKLVDLWLGNATIKISSLTALIFAVSSIIFMVHNVNTSIGNGMSFFKVQTIWMTFAAVIDIPLAWILVKVTGGWIGVVIANILALLPFEIIQPIRLMRYLDNRRQ